MQTKEKRMSARRKYRVAGTLLAGILSTAGCYHTPVETSELVQGPTPLRAPSPAREAESCCYEDSLTGGQVFAMYCSYCHNAPNLSERNFANFRNVASHMRVRANLTGKEYARLMEFLRRWNDVPPPNPPPGPGPKRLIFSQPVNELRPQTPASPGAPAAQENTPPRPEGEAQPATAGRHLEPANLEPGL
jgi:hypothetical protein